MIKMFTKKRKGFTLIELVVVIAILGILMAIAIPRFSGVKDLAAKKAIEAEARSLLSGYEIHLAQEGSAPADGTAMGKYVTVPTGGTYTIASTPNLFTYSRAENGFTWTATVGEDGTIVAVKGAAVTP